MNSLLEKYHHRQVVINYYNDEDFLKKRDGFQFERVEFRENCLTFTKRNNEQFSVALANFDNFSIGENFQHFYIWSNGTERVEVYFPS